MSSGIEAQLKTLDDDALAALLLKRAGFDEDFRLWLETELAALGARETRRPLDSKPFRRRVAALFEVNHDRRRRRLRDDVGSDIDEAALEELIALAVPFLDIGDGINALAILKPIAASLTEYWPQCAEWDETLHDYFPQLDRMISQGFT